MQTSMRLAAHNEDELSAAFDDATVATVSWLPALQPSQSWSGMIKEGVNKGSCGWDLCKVRDTTRTQAKVIDIQDAMDKLQESFPEASPCTMKKTCNGREKMTQDATLFLKNRSQVHTTVAALFQWVGQDESPFPSYRHKAKFVRDCARLYEKCGGHREVHGVISDLSRIMAVRFTGYDGSGSLCLVKTPVYDGDHVRTILTQFAFARPSDLGFERMSEARWTFNNNAVEGDRILGEGLHGSVFSVKSNGPRCFVKTFKTRADCQREVESLEQLNQNEPKVPSVPGLHGVSDDKRAILASPVGSSLEELRGKLIAWKVAAKFVVCLEKVHQAGLCHRDVRPSNMGHTTNNDDASGLDDVVLFDWASSCDVGSQPMFSGTLHCAAQDVLDTLADLADPLAMAEYDLESLVKSFWDITRGALGRPRAVTIETSNMPLNRVARNIQLAWQEEEQKHLLLKRFLSHARAKEYENLRAEFESLHG